MTKCHDRIDCSHLHISLKHLTLSLACRIGFALIIRRAFHGAFTLRAFFWRGRDKVWLWFSLVVALDAAETFRATVVAVSHDGGWGQRTGDEEFAGENHC